MFERALIFTRDAKHLAQRIFWVGLAFLQLRVLFQIGDGLRGIRIACYHLGVTQHVVGRREIRILLNNLFQHANRTIVILFVVKPFGCQIQSMRIIRKMCQ